MRINEDRGKFRSPEETLSTKGYLKDWDVYSEDLER